MAIKMLAIDLDGTLLTDSKTILPGGPTRPCRKQKQPGSRLC